MTNTETVDIATGLENLARGYRIIAANGHLDATLGHLSWRDPEGRGLWMKCQEVGLDEVEASRSASHRLGRQGSGRQRGAPTFRVAHPCGGSF